MPTYNDLATLEGERGMSPRTERANWLTGEVEIIREIECAWDDRVAVWLSLIGTAYPYHGATGTYAYNAKTIGWGKSHDAGNGLVGYEKARLTVFYTNRIWFIGGGGGGKWISEKFTPSTEYVPVSERSLCWESSTSDVIVRDNEQVGHRQVFGNYELTYYRLPALPNAVLTHQGASNNAPVASYTLGLTFPTETLILLGSPADRNLSSGFTRGWQLTYAFGIRPHGANNFWRAETQKWEPIFEQRHGGAQYKPYTPMNFSLLIP